MAALCQASAQHDGWVQTDGWDCHGQAHGARQLRGACGTCAGALSVARWHACVAAMLACSRSLHNKLCTYCTYWLTIALITLISFAIIATMSQFVPILLLSTLSLLYITYHHIDCYSWVDWRSSSFARSWFVLVWAINWALLLESKPLDALRVCIANATWRHADDSGSGANQRG